MSGLTYEQEVARRRSFAIIAHPDAGKTTLTEKLLLYGGAIHLAGSVKSRKANKHASSTGWKLKNNGGFLLLLVCFNLIMMAIESIF